METEKTIITLEDNQSAIVLQETEDGFEGSLYTPLDRDMNMSATICRELVFKLMDQEWVENLLKSSVDEGVSIN